MMDKELNKVADFMKKNSNKSLFVKDIRLAIYGDTENKKYEAEKIASILHELMLRGCVSRILVDAKMGQKNVKVMAYQWRV